MFLIRHTSPALADGVCYGRSDIPLPPDWGEACDSVATTLNGLGLTRPARVFSSPLRRCRQLAERLFPCNDIVEDERLCELHFGDWERQPWDRVSRHALDAWAADLAGFRPPGGENYRDLQRRVGAFARDRLSLMEGDCCVVGHGGSIRALLAFFLHNPVLPEKEPQALAALMRIRIVYGAVCHLSRRGPGQKVTLQGVHCPRP